MIVMKGRNKDIHECNHDKGLLRKDNLKSFDRMTIFFQTNVPSAE